MWPMWPIWPNFEVNGLDWQCCLAGSSKTPPRILFFSITMGVDYSFYVKFNATRAPTFLEYIISVLASVRYIICILLVSKLIVFGVFEDLV